MPVFGVLDTASVHLKRFFYTVKLNIFLKSKTTIYLRLVTRLSQSAIQLKHIDGFWHLELIFFYLKKMNYLNIFHTWSIDRIYFFSFRTSIEPYVESNKYNIYYILDQTKEVQFVRHVCVYQISELDVDMLFSKCYIICCINIG